MIEATASNLPIQNGLYHWVTNGTVAVLGKYDGSVFEGGDRLSMGIMADNAKALEALAGKLVIAEGDRFTNSTFIKDFDPVIIRINGDGAVGRGLRGSSQTERHLKSIATRVANIEPDAEVNNSAECLALLLEVISGKEIQRRDRAAQQSVQSMFNLGS